MKRSSEGRRPRSPSSVEVRGALRMIWPHLTAAQRRMLKHHYEAPHKLATMTQLADTVDYASYGGANLWYGNLGRRLSVAMGREPHQTRIAQLVQFINPGDVTNKDFVMLMRPEVARALRGWRWNRSETA